MNNFHKETIRVCVLMLCAGIATADTLYVNNDTAYPAEYRTFDTAFAAAASGDTIMLAPSKINYGAIVITGKAIKLVGNGTSTEHPLLQPKRADLISTLTGSITIGHDSHSLTGGAPAPNFSPSNGTVITGVRSNGGITVYSDDCVFARYETNSTFQIYGDRNVISGCKLAGFAAASRLNPDINSTGTLVRNSLIGSQHVTSRNNATATLVNCIFGFDTITLAPTGGGGIFSSFGGVTLRHCVIGANDRFNGYNGDGARLHHCLIVGDPHYGVPAHSANNGNITTTATTAVFEEGFVLKADSPAIAAGEDGEDLGIFGGPTPFEWGGVPAIPLIQKLEILSANPATGLRFKVQAVARD